MSVPMLAAKLYIPRVPRHLVARPRLVALLTESLERPLTLISAPPGFGKTTLVCEWRASLGDNFPVAWLSLDEDDNNPARCVGYVAAALETVFPGVGAEASEALRSSPQQVPKAALTLLLNSLDACAARPGMTAASEPEAAFHYALVLDDYHVITAAPVHETVGYLLDHLPPQMHLVIVTRADPPLPLARLRAHSALAEVRAPHLRFTLEEAATFLNQAMGLALRPHEVAALERRTEGWVAGLQMAALSIQGRDDAAEFVSAFAGSHQYVMDYLTDEALQRQPEPVREFLLDTSILDRLCGPLCDAVRVGSDSQEMLELLERANLFTVGLDDSRDWFQYHPLFAEMLRHRLQRASPERTAALHRRAAQWYERQGYTTEVISHTLAAGDNDRAAELVEQHARPMLLRAELSTLLRWVNALPEEARRKRPQLGVACAWTLTITGRWAAAETMLAEVELALERATGEGADEARRELALLRVYQASIRGDTATATRLAGALGPLPEGDYPLRPMVSFTLGVMYSAAGDLVQAYDAFEDCIRAGRATGNLHFVVPALSSLASVCLLQGRLRRAVEICREAISAGTSSGRIAVPVMANAEIHLGTVMYEWNDLKEALRSVRAGIERSRFWDNPTGLVTGHFILALVLQARGDMEGVGEALREAERVVREQDVTAQTRSGLEVARARLWLLQGNVEAALLWAKERGLDEHDDINFMSEPEYLVLARALLAGGQPGAAGRLLDRLRESTARGGRGRRLVEITALQALVYAAQNNTGQALVVLERCLGMAEPEGHVRLFVDLGAPMFRLLTALSRQWSGANPLRAYAANLLAAFPGSASQVASVGAWDPQRAIVDASAVPSPESLVERLSERELEVLRMIASGLTNNQVARELIITEGTVKAHTANIYRKLGVGNRTEAVARARGLDLL